jgi:hypothetical protein
LARACTKSGYGSFICPSERHCGNPYDYGLTPDKDDVIDNSQIYYGITTFENIGTSILTIH